MSRRTLVQSGGAVGAGVEGPSFAGYRGGRALPPRPGGRPASDLLVPVGGAARQSDGWVRLPVPDALPDRRPRAPRVAGRADRRALRGGVLRGGDGGRAAGGPDRAAAHHALRAVRRRDGDAGAGAVAAPGGHRVLDLHGLADLGPVPAGGERDRGGPGTARGPAARLQPVLLGRQPRLLHRLGAGRGDGGRELLLAVRGGRGHHLRLRTADVAEGAG